jgi:uncharacterized protein
VIDSEIRLGGWTQRPLRRIAPEIVPFWEGLRDHEFRLCTCRHCGAAYWPYTLCPRHDGFVDFDAMQWRAASGKGTIFAHITVHRVTDPAYAIDVPYCLAQVELDEGPLFPTRIVGVDPAAVRIGARVSILYFDTGANGLTLPLFAIDEPAPPASEDQHGN